MKHSGLEKTFVCSVCGSKFMTATDLKAHEKRHVSSGKLVLHKGRYPSRKGEDREDLQVYVKFGF